ncbi:MAG: SUMF1/EgtB/PvdO family nonheme iron enzyme [Myxococcales bacterium]|nr:SUMF1/EgtB/PvdO family nonheme iron enzyme [Myxococcales bacterium]
MRRNGLVERRGGAVLGAALLFATGLLRCSAILTWEDCASDRDCQAGERCNVQRRYCEIPVLERCNGVDDDRDGVSDDDEEFGTCEPGGMTGGSMRVCRDGVLRCRGGARLECVRRAAPRASETCNNGIDDECNGIVDDGAACVQNYPATQGLVIGSNAPDFGEGDDAPEHEVCLASYAIDKYEVTMAAYATFLSTLDRARLRVVRPTQVLNNTQNYGQYLQFNDNGTWVSLVLMSEVPEWSRIVQTEGGWAPGDTASRLLPMVNVTWDGANRYCRWAGKHLPTEAEFFRAARGADGRRAYPWGEEMPSCARANIGRGGMAENSRCVGRPVAVGSLVNGATPEGVFDLFGNVNEWMWDYHNTNRDHSVNNYYTSLAPTRVAWCTMYPNGPLGPAMGAPIDLPNGMGQYCQNCRMARGRHYETTDLRIGIRRWLDADRGEPQVGFRCSQGGADR